jgi:hypothetical protein
VEGRLREGINRLRVRAVREEELRGSGTRIRKRDP